ncbi:MAG TPA: adenylate kinase family protein [Methanothrix sp.]|jgi:adenylate kinase|nr:adenylate kinase family protein [Methanothrix sp.]
MKIALTGTPGTGKTTIAALLPYRVIDINSLVKGGMNLGKDPDRGCLEADMDALACRLAELDGCKETVILEGHFSHHFADRAIVLRLAPSALRPRLEARGYSASKIQENLEAEALDVILVEAAELCSRVDEIDTTGKSPEQVAEMAIEAIEGRLHLPPGQVDWLMEFFG